ncbi:hypothetical protein L1887_62828 [Cichorium endivia]|nr:hypothetical protein L1887_62828 [Cichorium endivia]
MWCLAGSRRARCRGAGEAEGQRSKEEEGGGGFGGRRAYPLRRWWKCGLAERTGLRKELRECQCQDKERYAGRTAAQAQHTTVAMEAVGDFGGGLPGRAIRVGQARNNSSSSGSRSCWCSWAINGPTWGWVGGNERREVVKAGPWAGDVVMGGLGGCPGRLARGAGRACCVWRAGNPEAALASGAPGSLKKGDCHLQRTGVRPLRTAPNLVATPPAILAPCCDRPLAVAPSSHKTTDRTVCYTSNPAIPECNRKQVLGIGPHTASALRSTTAVRRTPAPPHVINRLPCMALYPFRLRFLRRSTSVKIRRPGRVPES